MTTNELKHKLYDLGFCISKTDVALYVFNNIDEKVAVVRINDLGKIDTMFLGFNSLRFERKIKLLDVLHEYIKTPLNVREEKEKYLLKCKLGVALDDVTELYLNYSEKSMLTEGKRYFFGDEINTEMFQTHFTRKDIEKIPFEIKQVCGEILIEN